MGFNGSGNFIRSDGVRTGDAICQQQQVAGTGILPSLMDTELNRIASALESLVAKNGETGALNANLDVGDNNLVNVAAPTVAHHGVNKGYVDSNFLTTSAASGTYLTQASASSTYLTQAAATSNFLNVLDAASTYMPIDNPSFINGMSGNTITLTGNLNSAKVNITGATIDNTDHLGNPLTGALDRVDAKIANSVFRTHWLEILVGGVSRYIPIYQ